MRFLALAILLASTTISCGNFCCPPDPSITSDLERIIVEFPVVPETRAEFLVELDKILIDTRAFDACLGVTIWTNELDDDKVWLLEGWETRAHQEAYVNWRMETNNTSHLGPYLSGDLRFLWLEKH